MVRHGLRLGGRVLPLRAEADGGGHDDGKGYKNAF